MQRFLGIFFCLILNATLWAQQRAETAQDKAIETESIFINAERERLLGNFDKAIKLYQEVLETNPQSDACYFQLCSIYEQQSKLDSAGIFCKKAAQLNDKNEWYLLRLAKIQEQSSLFNDARKSFDQLITLQPHNEDYYYELADLYYRDFKKSEYVNTLNRLEQTIGITEKNSLKKIAFYMVSSDAEESVLAEYNKLITRYPSRTDFRHKLAEYYVSLGDTANAKAVYQAILEQKPNDAKSLFFIASLQSQQQSGGNKVTFLQSLLPTFQKSDVSVDQKIGQLQPFIAELSNNKDADFYNALSNLTNALVKAHPTNPKAFAAAGDVANFADKITEALQYYEQAIKLQTNNFAVWENALYLYESKKEYNNVITLAENALDYFPNQPSIYYLLGVSYNQLSNHNEALNALKTAKLMLTKGNSALTLKVLYQMAISYSGLRKYPEAKLVIDEAMKVGGDKIPEVQQLKKELEQ